MSWLKEQFTLLGKFFREGLSRTALWCAAGMIAAAVLGYSAAKIWPDAAWKMMEAFAEQIEEAGVVDETGQMSVFGLLTNNWRAMLLSALYGLVPFIYLPMVSLLSNGALIGVMAGVYQSNGISVLTLLAGLVPHGIFEIPALVLSIACGVKLCWNMCLLVMGDPRKIPFMELSEDILRVLVLVVAPLTAVAAVIESYITPVVMGWFL